MCAISGHAIPCDFRPGIIPLPISATSVLCKDSSQLAAAFLRRTQKYAHTLAAEAAKIGAFDGRRYWLVMYSWHISSSCCVLFVVAGAEYRPTSPRKALEDDDVEEEGQRQRSRSPLLDSEALHSISLTFCRLRSEIITLPVPISP